MKILLSHIKELIQVRNNAPEKVSGAEMKNLPTLKNAWLLLEDDRISDFGIMDEIPNFKVDSTSYLV
jgi:imidazolonepropionase